MKKMNINREHVFSCGAAAINLNAGMQVTSIDKVWSAIKALMHR